MNGELSDARLRGGPFFSLRCCRAAFGSAPFKSFLCGSACASLYSGSRRRSEALIIMMKGGDQGVRCECEDASDA